MKNKAISPSPNGGEGRGEGNTLAQTLLGKVRTPGSAIALFVVSAIALLPFIAGFPDRVGPPPGLDTTMVRLILLLVFSTATVVFAMQRPYQARLASLKLFAALAVIGLIAAELLRLDIRFPVVEIPTPHVLVSLLRLDGGPAYDADVLEIYCELWLATAAVAGLLYLTFIFIQLRRTRHPLTLALSPTSWERGNGSRP